MLGLITDRWQGNVDRLNALHKKGWAAMNEAERAEWVGDILSPALAGYKGAVNLLPNNNYYSETVNLKFRNRSVTATALNSGTYLYAVVIVGDAANFVNKTMTLSVDSIDSFEGCAPLLLPYWHDENGYEPIGGGLREKGSVTFNTGENAGGRAYLALYVYATTSNNVNAGAYVRYNGVMLEMGRERHDYVPYTEALPTEARKGAYNYCDLNRVERAVEELAEIIGVSVEAKTDWREWDVPKQADIGRILDNIWLVCGMVGTTEGLPATLKKLTYTTANNIEKALLEAESKAATMFRSGEIYCGEV